LRAAADFPLMNGCQKQQFKRRRAGWPKIVLAGGALSEKASALIAFTTSILFPPSTARFVQDRRM
jgi:hypothetical protein